MRRLAFLLAIPLLVAGAACGGDDDAVTEAGDSGDFCDRIVALDDQLDELGDSSRGSELPSRDVFEKVASKLEELQDDAPEEIADDLGTIVDGVRKVADVMGEVDLSDRTALTDPANADKLRQIGQEMEGLGEEIDAAGDRVDAYVKQECGIDLDDSDTSETSETTEG